MRKFTTAMFGDVDLDDPKIYEYLPKTTTELDKQMFTEIGMAICYMNYWHLDWFPKKQPTDSPLLDSGYKQRKRVMKLIKQFCAERRNNYENLQWYQEQVFIFQDETENMC
jgi:hypothetical protein